MFTTVAIRTWLTAPADALAVAPSSGAACRACRITPCAPAASADRRIAPTFCGSSIAVEHDEQRRPVRVLHQFLDACTPRSGWSSAATP